MPPRVSKTSALLLGFIASGFALLLSLTLLERFVLGLMVTPVTTTDEGAIRDTARCDCWWACCRRHWGSWPGDRCCWACGSS